MSTSEDRAAHFVCALALVTQGSQGSEESWIEETVEGRCHGHIAHEHRGEQGFGYDPIFVPSGLCAQAYGSSLHKKNLRIAPWGCAASAA